MSDAQKLEEGNVGNEPKSKDDSPKELSPKEEILRLKEELVWSETRRMEAEKAAVAASEKVAAGSKKKEKAMDVQSMLARGSGEEGSLRKSALTAKRDRLQKKIKTFLDVDEDVLIAVKFDCESDSKGLPFYTTKIRNKKYTLMDLQDGVSDYQIFACNTKDGKYNDGIVAPNKASAAKAQLPKMKKELITLDKSIKECDNDD